MGLVLARNYFMGNFQFGSFWGGSYSNVGHGSQIIPMWVGLAI
eukprot:COSAG01_NODE_49829_length_368_cov_4.223048_1_plen_42_part_01